MSSGPSVLEVLGRSAGGIARHVEQVVRGLDGRSGLTLEVAGPDDLPVDMGKPVMALAIPEGPVRGHAQAIGALRRMLAGGAYDLVHAHGLRAGIDSALAARGLSTRVRGALTASGGARSGHRGGDGPRVIVSVHNQMRSDILGGGRAVVRRRAETLAVRLADLVLAPSEEIARHLMELVPSAAAKIEVLHLGVRPPAAVRPAPEVRAELGVDREAALVVSAARLAPQKDLPVMLEAVAALPEDVALAVIGEGPLRGRLEGLAATLGIADRVRFTGWRDDAFSYVAAADVFCLSSRWEAVALAAQEAVALGVPVVATDVGGMPELIVDHESGRLVPPGDAASLAAALEEVLGDPLAARRYAAAARRRLEEGFSVDAMLSRLEGIYLERDVAG